MANTISGSLFKKMVTNGAINLKNNHQEINHLNVFPVPDGDTGTNMQMTMMAGIKEVSTLDSKSIVDVSKILSRGLLMGARGNSGVILSQFFRGVYSEIAKIKNGSATVDEFIAALVGGYQMAYRAVMTPVEGTILTVVREAAEHVLRERKSLKSVEDVLNCYLAQARVSLDRTPELLPVLKQAGVVDSGGAGFIKIIEGMLLAAQGQTLTLQQEVQQELQHEEGFKGQNIEDFNIEFGYCTEFIVKLHNQNDFDQEVLRNTLLQMGDSLVLVQDEELVKVHVHTNQPGVAITLGQKYGDLQTMKVENMRLQHGAVVESIHEHDHNHDHKEEVNFQAVKEERSKYGIIAVCFGDGIKQAFKELGVDYIIDGGQTMNPPTEEFIKAVKAVNAENVIILPNNSNVILSAEQTLALCEDQNIRVLKTKSIGQGYASLMVFDNTQEMDDNVEAMSEIVANMTTGELTYSVRDTEMNGVKIAKGDFIGITKGKIVVSLPDRVEAIHGLLDTIIKETSEIVTLFYGKDVSEDEITEVKKYIQSLNEDLEIEVINGKQDIYAYIVAVE
ncbi:DAK2 domain-containing protein [Paracholeplasma manati]|uniref:DAK2 domain-containing protein n=1 Tax=Paracholeplasma manati TaxID=591373 RepID=A0ABT2Y8J2_9MOLU|nr:DAK2 domain-containing protein [Paracholeplasma manati]MCV2232350.1 DAK2 domain-containing protein [Paracholeplasma manati]MDG0888065.1 DAK2 domain-containing protein [Paracholeplasma manati]